jgi:hypothetical protein
VGFPLGIVAHVSNRMGAKYDGIVGCDLLQMAGLRCLVRKGKWSIKIGEKTTLVQCIVPMRVHLQVGGTEIKTSWDQVWKKLWNEMAEVFYVEERPLSATGRMRHHIELVTPTPVFVKPRRYCIVVGN